MKPDRIAIIDCGTNTFHLLLIERDGNGYKELFKTKEVVKLAEEGIQFIGIEPFKRGLQTLKKFKSVIDDYQIEWVYAFGTAAIREAANSDSFIAAAKNETNIIIQTISGETEALLIYYGVRSAIDMNEQPKLIMDIGGGSVEFIIANQEKIFWKQSFPVGASILRKKFHQSEPISNQEINELINYLYHELEPLFSISKEFLIDTLVGASGSFDTFADRINIKFNSSKSTFNNPSSEINLENFSVIHHELLHSTMEERLTMPGLIPFRAEMIVVASILTQLVVSQLRIEKMFLSNYALKEGVLWCVLTGQMAAISE